MWYENRSSPSAAIGETTATSSSRSPSPKSAIFQRGTGLPRRSSVRARTP